MKAWDQWADEAQKLMKSSEFGRFTQTSYSAAGFPQWDPVNESVIDRAAT